MKYAVDRIMQITEGKINVKGVIFGIHSKNLTQILLEIQFIVLNASLFQQHCQDCNFILCIWNTSSVATTRGMTSIHCCM